MTTDGYSGSDHLRIPLEEAPRLCRGLIETGVVAIGMDRELVAERVVSASTNI